MNLEYLFNNIKSGDLISFHYKSWHYIAGVFIGKVTGKSGNDLKLPGMGHTGIVVNVVRDNNFLSFVFCEFLTSQKLVRYYSIIKKGNKYIIDTRFDKKNVDIYHTSIIKHLSKDEEEKVLCWWKLEGKYNLIDAMTSPDWAERILKVFGIVPKIKKDSNFCSGGVNLSLIKAGRKMSFEKPTPIELINDENIFGKTCKICLKN